MYGTRAAQVPLASHLLPIFFICFHFSVLRCSFQIVLLDSHFFLPSFFSPAALCWRPTVTRFPRSSGVGEMAVAGSCSGSRSPRRTPTPLTTLQFHARSAPGSRRSASSPELQLYVSACATEPGAATTATLLRPVPPTSSPPWLEKNHHEALESFSVVSQARQHGQSAAAAPGACRACRAR